MDEGKQVRCRSGCLDLVSGAGDDPWRGFAGATGALACGYLCPSPFFAVNNGVKSFVFTILSSK